MRAIAILCLGLMLTGCGGRANGVLVPSTTAQLAGTSRVDLLVATTRSNQGAPPGEMFTGERGRGLAFADIAVSLPPERKTGDVQWPRSLPADPRTDFVTLKAEEIDQAQVLSRFEERLRRTPQRRVLVFVHGYNTKFDEAVYRLAQIVHDSKAPALPILFTWPSRGRLLAYPYDRESANYSRAGLEAVLQYLAKDPRVGEVAILAHSMGNWVALEALRTMAIRDGRIAPKIKSVMLAAPDVDFDVFRRQIAEMGPHRPPFTMFVSRDDAALAASKRFWGSAARVGAVDPSVDPFKTEFAKDRIEVIDLTAETSSDRLNHAKFAQSPDVVRAIGVRLAEGQSLHDGGGGVGEKLGQVALGAAQTVGQAASVAVSAPIALVDRKTREGLGDQIRSVGQSAAGTVGLDTSTGE